MKIDVLSIGAFPEATNAELVKRFAVTRYLQRPAPDALSADLKNRIRGVATEANRGADRALISALPKLEVIAVFGDRWHRSRRRARAQHTGDQYARRLDG
jgi:lactate dehydrogenase-like 2-hydroxyacid dehydrogenase